MAYRSVTLETSVLIEEVVSLHYFEYMSDFTFPGEAHDFWELVCVDKGEIDVRADDKIITVKRGTVIFHKPNEFHNVLTNGKVAPNLIVIGFVCSSPCMEAFKDQVLAIHETESGLLAQIIAETRNAFAGRMDDPYQEQLVKLPAPAAFGAEQLIRHALEALIIQLYRRYFDNTVQVRPYRQPGASVSNETCNRVIHYMEEHLSEQLTISRICRDNLTGRSRLQKLFQENCGRGIIDYFNHMKIAAAKQMIRDNHLNFTEISDRLGYASVHYFSRQFKKLTGMTPSEYAASIRSLAEKPAREPDQSPDA